MKFKNSILYVQKKLDGFLRLYRHFAKCYIDNIIIFFRSAKEHFQYLKTIFALFARFKIILKSKKSYLNYLSIILLEQKMNDFEFITIEKRITTIKKMRFSKTLKTLEIYLEMIN